MDFGNNSECALADCHILSKLPCSGCTIVNYCCEDHQKADWGNHQNVCSSPLTLKTSVELGRHYVASRDIKAGTLLVSELPLLVGPLDTEDNSQSQGLSLKEKLCLACCKPAADDQKCPKCDWPICSSECSEAKIHAENECPLFVQYSLKMDNIDYEAMMGVFMLRAMLIKKSQPQIWAEIQNMRSESLDTSRRPEEKMIFELGLAMYCRGFRENFQKLERDFGEFFFKSKELVDLFEIHFNNGVNYLIISDDDDKPMENNTTAKIIYLKSSMFSHACFPNCLWSISSGPEFKREIRTAVDIAKGQVLSISYNKAEFVVGSMEHNLNEMKQGNFNCFCARCVDPTELNSMISAVKCKRGDCQDGYLIPKDPKNFEPSSIWACVKCGDHSTETWERVKQMTQIVENIAKKFQEFEPKKIKDVLNILRKNLHPNHWVIQMFCQQVKKELMGKLKSCTTRQAILDNLDYFIETTRYLLQIFHLTMPGFNYFKSEVQIELFMMLDIKFWRIDKRIELAKEMVELFDQVLMTKKFDPRARTKNGQWKPKMLNLMAMKEKLDGFLNKN